MTVFLLALSEQHRHPACEKSCEPVLPYMQKFSDKGYND